MFEIKPNFAKTLIIVFTMTLVAIASLKAGQFDPDLYAGMRWRLVGPFRAGRVSAVVGVIGFLAVRFSWRHRSVSSTRGAVAYSHDDLHPIGRDPFNAEALGQPPRPPNAVRPPLASHGQRP